MQFIFSHQIVVFIQATFSHIFLITMPHLRLWILGHSLSRVSNEASDRRPLKLKWSTNLYKNQYFDLRGTLKCFKWSAHQKSLGTTELGIMQQLPLYLKWIFTYGSPSWVVCGLPCLTSSSLSSEVPCVEIGWKLHDDSSLWINQNMLNQSSFINGNVN